MFLTRGDQTGADALHARRGQVAVLVLRAVASVAAPDAAPDPDAARRETQPARDVLAYLDAGGSEVAHLAAILDAVEALEPLGPGPLCAALASYARFLATESDPDEAADVLDTLVDAAAGPDTEERVRLDLLVAELRAELGNWDDAARAIARAARLAKRLGDQGLLWECHLTAAQVLRAGAQLEAARRRAQRVGAEARLFGRHEFIARAEIELAWVCEARSAFEQALEHAVRALEAWREGKAGDSALLKIGWILARLGEPDTAARAFDEVLRGDLLGSARYSALLGLLRCAMVLGDRAAFERRRAELEALLGEMPAALHADVYYHLALGHETFGNRSAAAEMADKALALTREWDDDLETRIAEFQDDPAVPWAASEPSSERTRRLARTVDRLLGV